MVFSVLLANYFKNQVQIMVKINNPDLLQHKDKLSEKPSSNPKTPKPLNLESIFMFKLISKYKVSDLIDFEL